MKNDVPDVSIEWCTLHFETISGRIFLYFIALVGELFRNLFKDPWCHIKAIPLRVDEHKFLWHIVILCQELLCGLQISVKDTFDDGALIGDDLIFLGGMVRLSEQTIPELNPILEGG